MGHSKISPSSAYRFFECPGSVQAQAKIDFVEPSNPAALEGLAIHALAAKCLEQNKHPKEFEGEIIEVKNTYKETVEFTVNDDFIFAVGVYCDTIDSVLKTHNLNRSALQIETYFKLPEIDKEARGTVDCSFIAEDTLYVIDLKGGRGIVINPEENKQCMYYALRPYLDAKMFIKRIVIMIIQPRAKEGEFIKVWETTPQRMDAFAQELKKAIAKTRVKKPDLKEGPWCKFCLAQGNCEVFHRAIFEPVKAVVPHIDCAFPKITQLTAEQIGTALPALEVLKGFLENLHRYALALASKGEDIPNYSLTRSNKRRVYRDKQAVIDAFEGEYGDQIYAPLTLRSPAQLEKIIDKEQLSDYVTTPEGNLKLVPTKEAKDFISRKIEDVFKDVEFED